MYSESLLEIYHKKSFRFFTHNLTLKEMLSKVGLRIAPQNFRQIKRILWQYFHTVVQKLNLVNLEFLRLCRNCNQENNENFLKKVSQNFDRNSSTESQNKPEIISRNPFKFPLHFPFSVFFSEAMWNIFLNILLEVLSEIHPGCKLGIYPCIQVKFSF